MSDTLKVYNKRGAPDYKEKKLIEELRKALSKKMEEDADFKFQVANNKEELKSLHRQYCVEDATIVEDETTEKEHNKSQTESSEQTSSETLAENSDSNGEFKFEDPDFETPDPFNAANPKVRDYVLKDSMSPDSSRQSTESTSINEPTSHSEAFTFPEFFDNGGKKKQTSNNSSSTASDDKPFNPAFDEMSSGKKVKQTKRFAKYIVEGVCMLLEHGYVWWTTKDINDSALASYELNDEMDLSLLLSLDGDQQITVREFFSLKCSEAKTNAKIDPDDKEELADALADVMMEKGIAPTPTQTLIMVSLKVVGGQFMKAFISRNETNGILAQLRAMKVEDGSPSPAKKTQPKTRQNEPAQNYTEQTTNHVEDEEEHVNNSYQQTEGEELLRNIESGAEPVVISQEEDDLQTKKSAGEGRVGDVELKLQIKNERRITANKTRNSIPIE